MSMYDRELQKVKEQRNTVKQFIDSQQRWLSKMRQEVIQAGIGSRVPAFS